MEIQNNQEMEKPRRAKRKKIELTLEEGAQIEKRHEETPSVGGMAAPEISREYAAEVAAKDEERFKKLKDELGAQMAVPKGERDAALIEKLRDEVKELEALVKKGRQEARSERPSADAGISEPGVRAEAKPEAKERKMTIKTVGAEIEKLDKTLKEAISRRLAAIRSTDSAAFQGSQKEISQIRDELVKLRAEQDSLREANKTFVKDRMREALAHYEKSQKEKTYHAKFAEVGVTLDELKEQELSKKDMERWNKLLEADAKQNRENEDYKSLRSEYESLEPEAAAEFLKGLRAEAQKGDFEMQHAAAQVMADIDAGRIAGFTEMESEFFAAGSEEVRARTEAIETMGEEEAPEEAVAEWEKIKKQSAPAKGSEAEKKFFSASEKEAHERAEAIEIMGPEMTVEEAVAEWEKIKASSSKGDRESRETEEAFIDFLHDKYPDYVDFSGKEYSEAKAKPQKIGFFKRLFSFGNAKTRLEEMEEALESVPNTGRLAGKFLISRLNRAKKELRPISVKSR